jgi:hypothetical protein
MRTIRTNDALALVAAALLAACGGSDPAPPPADHDSLATAYPIALGRPEVATITAGTDYDFFAFPVPEGGATVRVQTFDGGGSSCDLEGGAVDTFVQVFEPGGARTLWSDDSGIYRCEDVRVELPAGTGYVAVTGYAPYPFDYTVVVTVP